MPRLRALILSLLMLGSCLVAAEAWLKHQQSAAVVFPFGKQSCWGWQPAVKNYWQAPRQQNWTYRRDDGTRIELNYDEQGLRRLSGTDLPTANIICLGDTTLLAPHLPASQTLTAIWQQAVEKRNPAFQPTEVIASGGMPLGSPLLWWLQKERLFSAKPDLLVAFVSQQTLLNDAELRRRTEFDSQGYPLQARHPLATDQNHSGTGIPVDETSTWNRLKNSCLVKWGLPQLFLLYSSPEQPIPAGDLLTSEKRSQGQIHQAIEPLRWLQQELRNQQAQFLVIYLPDATELSLISENLNTISQNGKFTTQNPLSQPAVTSLRSYLTEFSSQQQLPFIDLTPLLVKYPDQSTAVWNTNGELTADGHQRIAKILSQTVPTAK